MRNASAAHRRVAPVVMTSSTTTTWLLTPNLRAENTEPRKRISRDAPVCTLVETLIKSRLHGTFISLAKRRANNSD
jgi:hypothetical protein